MVANSITKNKFANAVLAKYHGIYWCNRSLKWVARPYIEGKQIYGGIFVHQIDAAKRVNGVCVEFNSQQQNPGIGAIYKDKVKTAEEVYVGMMGTLNYEEGPLKFQVIKIQNERDKKYDERTKSDIKRNFKHKVKYHDDQYPDEWLFLDLKKNTYRAFNEIMFTNQILEIGGVRTDTNEHANKETNSIVIQDFKENCFLMQKDHYLENQHNTDRIEFTFPDRNVLIVDAKQCQLLPEKLLSHQKNYKRKRKSIIFHEEQYEKHIDKNTTSMPETIKYAGRLIDSFMSREYKKLSKFFDKNTDFDAVTIQQAFIETILLNKVKESKMEQLLNTFTKDGESSLCIAAKYGCHNIVKFLILNGANKEHFTNDFQTPLSLAVRHNHLKVVEILFEEWISPNSHEKPYLHLLPIFNVKSIAIAQLLVDNDAITRDLYNENYQTPLLVACKNGYLDVVKFFSFE